MKKKERFWPHFRASMIEMIVFHFRSAVSNYNSCIAKVQHETAAVTTTQQRQRTAVTIHSKVNNWFEVSRICRVLSKCSIFLFVASLCLCHDVLKPYHFNTLWIWNRIQFGLAFTDRSCAQEFNKRWRRIEKKREERKQKKTAEHTVSHKRI